MGRPSVPLLSRELIARTALRLVDIHGTEGVAMRRVARELDVNPSSLYNHFGSRLELVEEVRALVARKIDVSPFRTLSWDEAVMAWADSYRLAFAEHPNSIPLLMSTSSSSPTTMHMYEEFTLAALRAGWQEADIVPMLTALESFIIGSVLDMTGPKLLFDPTGQEETFPAFASAVATVEAADPADPVAGRAFELGLRSLVHGLGRHRAPGEPTAE